MTLVVQCMSVQIENIINIVFSYFVLIKYYNIS